MQKKVNVVYCANSVTHDELLTIPRIGDMVAQLILQKKEELGGKFTSIEDLRKLPGMGAGKLEVLAKYLSFDGSGVTPTTAEDIEPEKIEKIEDFLSEDDDTPQSAEKPEVEEVKSEEDAELDDLAALL